MSDQPRKTGTVKWFNNVKGFGFLIPDGGGSDVFIHYSSIQQEGFRSLDQGQPVEYVSIISERGELATQVWAAGSVPTGETGAEGRHENGSNL